VVPRHWRDGRPVLWLVVALVLIVAADVAYWAMFRRAASVETAEVRVVHPPPTTDAAFLPRPTLTPGATLRVTRVDICVRGYSRRVRDVPEGVKRSVYRAYGIFRHAPGEYEVDHLISLELGGSNSARNLWPESYRTKPWNARVKDRLENELHRRVCTGELDLGTAQRQIAGNWIQAYRYYFHTDEPPSGRP
jgi:hypothetical protein